MKKIEVLNQGMTDSLDILNDAVMDNLLGGTIKCKKEYSFDNYGKVTCGCGYSNDGGPVTDFGKNPNG